MTKKEFMRELGQNLKSVMEEYNMTQRELAKETNISKQTISAYVCGERMPSLDNLANIAYVLNCDLDELVIIDEMIE